MGPATATYAKAHIVYALRQSLLKCPSYSLTRYMIRDTLQYNSSFNLDPLLPFLSLTNCRFPVFDYFEDCRKNFNTVVSLTRVFETSDDRSINSTVFNRLDSFCCWSYIRGKGCINKKGFCCYRDQFTVSFLQNIAIYGEANSVKNITINIWLNDGIY